MALKHVNAVIVGAGAGAASSAKELAEARTERGPAGARQVVYGGGLPEGRFTQSADVGAGAAFGPDDERNPRVAVDLNGQERVVLPSEGSYSNNAACVGGGTFSLWRAWRGAIMEKDFRMRSHLRSAGGQHAEDWPISYAIWSRTTRRRNRRSACRAMCRRTRSTGRGVSRCPCRRCRRTANTGS